jgi:protein-disulfide isomerase
MPVLQKDYIDTGKLKFVMREYPLPSLHKNAINASMAALCAGNQGKYWEMHNLMFDNQKQLDLDNLKVLAASTGLDASKFNECMDNKDTDEQVRTDMASGTKLGMRGTPGFFIGVTDPDNPDEVNLSVFIRGAQSVDSFKASIDDLLKAVE